MPAFVPFGIESLPAGARIHVADSLTPGSQLVKWIAMCGRFSLTVDAGKIADAITGLQVPSATNEPRFNLCPSQPVVVVLNDGKLQVTKAKWGLIPSWAKAADVGHRLANARCEGLAAKPSFRGPFQRRRCLVLADGFYEWKPTKPKTPYYFRLKTRAVFAFAGLWDVWRNPDGQPVVSCCLITTTPNAVVAPVHDRMPVILQRRFYDLWLSEGERPVADLEPALVPYPAEEMEGFPVSTLVNRPQNDQPACIQPAEQGG
jgi:putative SOS response-associated peptidase YedK